jgi:flagellar hook-associated protein 2
VTFAATDTLQQVTDKINQANAGVSASVIRDGAGSTPFRLNLTASASGTAGRFIITSGGLDLGLNALDAGNDARLFFGGADPSRGVAVTSSTNQIDGLIPGVKIDAKSVSATPVTLSVTSDVDSIVSQVKVFIEAFNTAITRIDVQTNYDEAADKGGPLLGDSTALELRGALFRLAQGPVQGASGRYTRLTDVGVKVGSGGKLELDESKFRTALSTDFASVETLFVARDVVDDRRTTVVPGVTVANTNPGTTFSRLGIMGQFEQLGERYTTTVGGVLTNRNKGFDDQVNLQRDRIEAFNTRLERRRGILERQFAAMESAIARLQTQSSSLGSIRQAG